MLPVTVLAADSLDFNTADFGKSRTEVKAMEPGLLNAEDTLGLSYRIQVAFGMQTHKYYDFTPGDKLAAMAYAMLPKTDEPAEAFAKYDQIKAYLQNTYGEPAVYEEINYGETLDPLNPDSRDAALMSGDLCLWTLWETERLELLLFMENKERELVIRLNIKDKALFTEM